MEGQRVSWEVQNAIAQAKNFQEAINVTALLLAKLDGSAKGGFVFAIRDALNIPVKFIGLGETPQDVETFDPKRFVDALFGEEETKRRRDEETR